MLSGAKTLSLFFDVREFYTEEKWQEAALSAKSGRVVPKWSRNHNRL
jgi:hypothetical protein